MDAALEDSDEDDEIRYLQRIKSSKIATYHNPESGDDKEGGGVNSWVTWKGSRRSTVYHSDAVYGLSSRSTRESWRKSVPGKGSSDADYVVQEELQSKRKKQKKESVNSSADGVIEPLTTRQRGVRGDGSSSIEFPNGLSFASSKSKDAVTFIIYQSSTVCIYRYYFHIMTIESKLSEEEKLAKKAEAAKRRKMQMEKAAKESEVHL